MMYTQHFTAHPLANRSLVLRIENLSQAASVLINGRHAGDTLWQPFEVEVTGLLQQGENRLDLRIYGSLRNTLGPWHFPAHRTTHGYSERHFTDEIAWQDDYDFVPMGLLGRGRLIAR